LLAVTQILDSGFRRNDNKVLPLFVTPAKAGVQWRLIQRHLIVYAIMDSLVILDNDSAVHYTQTFTLPLHRVQIDFGDLWKLVNQHADPG
jgi:hypothetical protein